MFKIITIRSQILVSQLNPFVLLWTSLVYGISSANNVQKGVCHVGCAKTINPDSSLVSPKGFWEPDIRCPKENTHGLSFSMSSLALFVYFYDDGDWKLKVERQEPHGCARCSFVSWLESDACGRVIHKNPAYDGKHQKNKPLLWPPKEGAVSCLKLSQYYGEGELSKCFRGNGAAA